MELNKLRLKLIVWMILLLFCEGLEISKVKGTLKQLERHLMNLVNCEDTVYDDKELILNEYLERVTNLENIHQKNVDNESLLPKFVNEIENIRNVTEIIKERSEKRRKDRFSQECVDDIILRRFKSAVTKLYLIDITRIPNIVSEVYKRGGKFKLMIEFSDEIPSILLTFEMYKALNNSVSPEEGLSLISNIGKNVIFQYSVSPAVKIEGYRLVDHLKADVADWVAAKFKRAVEEKREDEDLTKSCDAIANDVKDLKLLREIADKVLPENIDYDYHEDFLRAVKNMGAVSKITFVNHLLFRSENIIDENTIWILIKLYKVVYSEYDDLTIENKKMIDSFGMPDLKNRVAKMFAVALKGGFYDVDETDRLSKATVQYDRPFFKDAVRISFDKVYDEDLIEIIELFRGNDIEQSAVAYQVVFESLESKDDDILKQFGAYLKLEIVVTEALEDEDLIHIKVDIVTELKKIQFQVLELKKEVSDLLKYSLLKGNTTENVTLLLTEAFKANIEYFSKELADHYGEINTEKLINYAMEFLSSEEIITSLILLQDNIIVNSNELYFKIASCYKIIKDKPNYSNMTAQTKLALDSAIMKLPFSIRASVFGKEFYLRSWKNEYLGLSDKINNTRQLYTLKNGTKSVECRWSFEKTEDPSVFKIKNRFYDEYLAADRHRDGYSRKVFSSGRHNGNDWRIVLSEGGVYIKNVLYNEYLNPGKKDKNRFKRFVYTFPLSPKVPLTVWKIKEIFHDDFL